MLDLISRIRKPKMPINGGLETTSSVVVDRECRSSQKKVRQRNVKPVNALL